MSESQTPPAEAEVVTPVEAPEVIAHTESATLLESVAPDKPAEVAAEVVEKPAEAAPIETPAEPAVDPAKPVETAADPVVEPVVEAAPVNYEFTLPEGFTAPPERIEAVKDLFRESGVSPENAQKLVDQYTDAVRELQANQYQFWQDSFKSMRDGWVERVLADPQLGQSGHRTALTAAARARDMLMSNYTPEQKVEFGEFLRDTGAGDHPAFLRILYSASRYFDEPSAPAAAQIPAPRNGARPGARFAEMYDHPTSTRARG